MLRIGSSYRTISTVLILMITVVIPLELFREETLGSGTERKLNRGPKKEHWIYGKIDATTTWKWNKKLIPNIRFSIGCSHRCGKYHLTQFINDHGYIEHKQRE